MELSPRHDHELAGPERAPLPPPVVTSDVYDTDYYLHCCAGYDAWVASEGRQADPLYAWSLKLAGFSPGEVVVDIGTGRGELLPTAVEMGAGKAIGVEYSADAVQMARRTLEARETGPKAEVIHADARSTGLDDGVADLVTMLDVVEHLSPAELLAVLVEARRLLRPGGRVFVHTFPTRTMYEMTYRLLRLGWPGGRRWPVDPRNDFEHAMHVNEQSATRLRRSLRRAGFVDRRVWHGQWVHTAHIPSARAQTLVRQLAAFRATRSLGASDLWAFGYRER